MVHFQPSTLTNLVLINFSSYSGSFINADDSTLDFTNVKTLGPVDSDGKVISGCANDEPLITLVKSIVDFDDVVVVGFQSQSIVTTDSIIDLETVLVRHSTANDGNFELTNSDLKLTNVEFKNLEGKVFDLKSDFKVEGSNVYYCVGNLGCLIMVISRGTNNHNQTQKPKYQVSMQYREQFSLSRVFVYRYINDCLIINHSVFDCLLLITVKKDLSICICIVYLLSILYYLCCFVFFNYYSDEVVVVDCQSQFFVATNFTIHFKTVVSSNNDPMIVTDASTIGSSTICELSSDWVPDLTTHGDVEANPGPSIDLSSIKSLEPMEFVVDEVINYFSAKWMIQSNHVSILNVNVVQSALLDEHESMVRTMRNYIITPILNNHNCRFVIIPINDVFGKTVSSMDIKSGGMGNHWIVLVIDVMGFLKKLNNEDYNLYCGAIDSMVTQGQEVSHNIAAVLHKFAVILSCLDGIKIFPVPRVKS
ncbi:hypothetical protein P9112_013333 [Eukaryota sp. TZLM1-RC]